PFRAGIQAADPGPPARRGDDPDNCLLLTIIDRARKVPTGPAGARGKRRHERHRGWSVGGLAVKITGVETVYLENEDLCYVRVRTDEGVTGLGETCFGPRAVAAYIHESAAPRLVGQDPLEIERHARDLPRFYIGHGGTGVSTRAHSAIDLALWDILGKVAGQPLYQLWGGRCRDKIRIYNTCAG